MNLPADIKKPETATPAPAQRQCMVHPRPQLTSLEKKMAQPAIPTKTASLAVRTRWT